MLLFVLLLILCFGIIYFVLRPTKTESAVQQKLAEIQDNRDEETGRTILKEEGYSPNEEVAQIIRQLPGAYGTLNLLRQSGQNWSVAQVMGVSLGATVLTAW